MKEIRSFKDYKEINAEIFEQAWRLFKPKDMDKKEALENWNTSKKAEYNNHIKPIIDKIGQKTGSETSLFNPLRTTTNVAFYKGKVCEFYKEKYQKLERYVEIHIPNKY